MSLPERYAKNSLHLEKMKEQNLFFFMKKIEAFSKDRVKIEGRNFINFTSNDYLGFAYHPKIKEAAIKAIKKYGVGSGQTRVFGSIDIHEELEEKLAKLIGTEAVITFNSGYMANFGTIPVLVGEGDFIIRDEYCHASIVDGCRISRSTSLIFKHNDMKSLENKLSFCDPSQQKLILADSVYSMHGHVADLPEICRLKEKYNAVLIIDDAHATGVLGKNGGGAAEHFNLHDKIDFISGSMGKALGGNGGFIGSSKEWITYLKENTRSFIFTTSMPPPLTAAVITAIDLLNSQPQIRKRLLRNAQTMRDELRGMGYEIGETQTQIIPIVIGDEFVMCKFVARLFDLGIVVNPVIFPAVRTGRAQVRICITSLHTKSDLTKTLEILEKVGGEFGIIGNSRCNVA
jgi:8-amino-7-oxononanoate synthase